MIPLPTDDPRRVDCTKSVLNHRLHFRPGLTYSKISSTGNEPRFTNYSQFHFFDLRPVMQLNQFAKTLCQQASEQAARLRIQTVPCGDSQLIDFGIGCPGGIEAGRLLAQICLGGCARVDILPIDLKQLCSPQGVMVTTDHPLLACLAGQYAGWPVQVGKFFAMGSGPMRQLRGREAMLEELDLLDASAREAVGVLETDRLPTPDVLQSMADECHIKSEQLTVCVAPVTSLAGVVQVVARSVETALHKMHALGLSPATVVSACGTAPLPPVATEMVRGIGTTNDAILYGGRVTLWVNVDQEQIDELGPHVPSSHSLDYGRPFAEIFKSYNYDFYKVDPQLFSPAEVTFVNLRSGIQRTFGKIDSSILQRSFNIAP